MNLRDSLPSSSPEVSVIVPCFNGASYIQNCLRSIELTKGPSREIIVVDNASTDASLDFIRQFRVRIIANKHNVGFPGAVNQAVDQARGNLLVILNQDTEVHPDWLEELKSVLSQDSKVGVCGPKMLDLSNRNRVQQLGVLVDRFGFSSYGSLQNKIPREVFMVSGAAMMIRHDLFDLVGRFDREYFLFEDDLDLCWRVHLAGYKVMVNPRAVVYHYGGSAMKGGFPTGPAYRTTGARRYLSERNTLQTLLKNYELSSIIKRVPVYLSMNLLEMVLFVSQGKVEAAKAYIMSLGYNLVHFRNTWKKHMEVETLRRVEDTDIFPLFDKRNLKLIAFLRWGIPSFEKPAIQSRPND